MNLRLRGFNNYDADLVSVETGLSCPADENQTQQQFKEECDINEIVRRFGLTGELPDMVRLPQSGDFTQITDYHTALLAVRQAEEGFLELPAELRARFNNDPGRVIAFLDDPDNREEAMKLGLVNKPPEKTRDVIQAVDDLAAKIVPPKAS